MPARTTVRTTRIDDLVLAHDDRVLAPRPWTAAQSAWARELLGELPPGPVLELCSGVGHIGLLALRGNTRSLVMVDASAAACELARLNAEAAGLGHRVEIRPGLLGTVPAGALGEDERFPLVVADPPWVPSDQLARFPEDPVTAIDGGTDGLVAARACLEVADRHLDPAGCCLLQLGTPAQVLAVRTWLDEHPTLRLMVEATRGYPRGVVVLLRRPTGAPAC